MKISNTILRSFVAATKHYRDTGIMYGTVGFVRYQGEIWITQRSGNTQTWVRLGDGDLPDVAVDHYRFKKLVGAVGKADQVDIQVDVDTQAENLGTVHLEAGKLRATMTVMDRGVMQPMVSSDDTVTEVGWIEGDELFRALSKVQPFQSVDEIRPNLRSVRWECPLDSYQMVATNGKSLIIEPVMIAVSMDEDNPVKPPSWTLHRDAVQAILDAKDLLKGQEFRVFTTENSVWFRSQNLIIQGSKIDMDFPDYNLVIPDPTRPIVYQVHWQTKDVLDALKKLKPFVESDREIVTLRNTPDGIEICAPSDSGDVTVAIPGEIEGNLDEWFALPNLARCLKAMPERCTLTSRDEDFGPRVMQGDNEDGIVLIMPIRREK